MSNKWFMSDPHYMHKNLVYECSVWHDKETSTRKGFKDEHHMSQHIVEQINKYVAEDDELYNLGDWSFGGIENIWNFRKQIVCKNIHFIPGNHDEHIIKNKILPNCKRDRLNPNLIVDGVPNGEDYVQAQSLFKSYNSMMKIKIDHCEISMLHFPIECWTSRGGRENSIHLHGHMHGTSKEALARVPKRLDVGLDNALILLGEYRPFSWEEVKRILL